MLATHQKDVLLICSIQTDAQNALFCFFFPEMVIVGEGPQVRLPCINWEKDWRNHILTHARAHTHTVLACWLLAGRVIQSYQVK